MTTLDGRDGVPETVLAPPSAAASPVPAGPATFDLSTAWRRLGLTPDDLRSSLVVIAKTFAPVLAGLAVVIAVVTAVALPDDFSGSLADWLQTAVVVLALALGGRLVVDGSVAVDGVTAEVTTALRLMPLVVTVLVLGLVARATARAERQNPSAALPRLLARSALTGLVAGVITGLLALLASTSSPYGLDLGEQFDIPASLDVGAGAFGAFLGATVLVLAAAAFARLAATHSLGLLLPAAGRRDPERTRDLRVALRVLHSFAVALLAVAVVGLVLAFLDRAFLSDALDGGRLAVLGGLLVLGLNAALALALGVLGVPMTAAGQSKGSADLMDAFHDSTGSSSSHSFGLLDSPWLLLVLLVPMAIALGTAVRRALREPGVVVTPRTVQLAAGLGAAAALAAALLVRVAASGTAAASASASGNGGLADVGIGGSLSGTAGFSANPSLLWAPLLGAVWAAAVVWAVRFGPTLALSLPPRAARLLAGRGISAEWSAALAGTAPAPAGHRSTAVRWTAVVAAAVVALAAVGSAVVAVLNATVFTPEAAAADYLKAIADRDVAAVVAQLADPPKGNDQPLLSTKVLGSDDFSPINHPSIGAVHEYGDSATVDVAYVVAGHRVDDSISLSSGGGLFRDWRVDESLPGVDSSSDSGLGRRIGGVALDDGSYLALPGRYVAHPADDPLLTADDSAFVVTTDSAQSPSLEPRVKPEALSTARHAVDAVIAKCAAATTLPLHNCPFLTESRWDDVTNPQITITEQPEYSLEYDESTGTLQIDTESNGWLTLTGTETADMFSGPEQQSVHETYWFNLNGEITVSGSGVRISFDE
jgi:hypothetical protein